MIIREYYSTRQDGIRLFRTYSDLNMMIRQNETGFLYNEAIDVEGSSDTYTETDIPIEEPDVPDSVALSILLGGDADETA